MHTRHAGRHAESGLRSCEPAYLDCTTAPRNGIVNAGSLLESGPLQGQCQPPALVVSTKLAGMHAADAHPGPHSHPCSCGWQAYQDMTPTVCQLARLPSEKVRVCAERGSDQQRWCYWCHVTVQQLSDRTATSALCRLNTSVQLGCTWHLKLRSARAQQKKPTSISTISCRALFGCFQTQ